MGDAAHIELHLGKRSTEEPTGISTLQAPPKGPEIGRPFGALVLIHHRSNSGRRVTSLEQCCRRGEHYSVEEGQESGVASTLVLYPQAWHKVMVDDVPERAEGELGSLRHGRKIHLFDHLNNFRHQNLLQTLVSA
jgi:hypothetical protein